MLKKIALSEGRVWRLPLWECVPIAAESPRHVELSWLLQFYPWLEGDVCFLVLEQECGDTVSERLRACVFVIRVFATDE